MHEVFPMIPATTKVAWFLVPFAALMLGFVGFFGYIAWSTQHVQFQVTPTGLRITGDMYGRTIPFDQLDVTGAAVVDLTHDREHALRWRTNGVGLPGYQSGWFRMANGGKALAFLTDHHRVVLVPTRKGYTLLMSTAEGDGLLGALRRATG